MTDVVMLPVRLLTPLYCTRDQLSYYLQLDPALWPPIRVRARADGGYDCEDGFTRICAAHWLPRIRRLARGTRRLEIRRGD
jgi:hypothetical protein